MHERAQKDELIKDLPIVQQPIPDFNFPDPTITMESETYWQACNDGKLLLKRCADCGKTIFTRAPFVRIAFRMQPNGTRPAAKARFTLIQSRAAPTHRMQLPMCDLPKG